MSKSLDPTAHPSSEATTSRIQLKLIHTWIRIQWQLQMSGCTKGSEIGTAMPAPRCRGRGQNQEKLYQSLGKSFLQGLGGDQKEDKKI